MKKLFIIAILAFIPFLSHAQSAFKAVITDVLTNEPLNGATAVLKGTINGSITDQNGKIEIKNIPYGQQTIVISYIGYEKKELTFVFPLADSLQGKNIFLKSESKEMEEVVITTTRTNSRIENIPIRVEVIGEQELDEEGSIKPANISKLLLESSSTQAQQTSAVNGNVSIRLQGLDGKYTQILKDGFPLYSGFAQGLSPVQIPPLDLKQVEIIKGSSSSLYGSDAIAGIINLISKQPQAKKELTFLLNQTSLFGTDINAYFSQRWKKFGFSLLTANNFQLAQDVNHDGFSDLPKTKTYNLAPTFYYYFNPKTTLQFGVTATYDNRKGGDMKVLKNETDSLHKFFEENISNRIASQLKFQKGKLFTLKNSVSYFDREQNQPLFSFKGKQISSYTEAAFNFDFKKNQFVTGINFTTDNFSEDSSRSHLQRRYNYFTTGIFLQDDWKPNEKFTLEAGLRTDYQNQFGFFVLPRLALMYKFTKNFYARAGGGFGYKVPSIFSTASEEEGINNIQPLANNIKAENSIGANLDFNYKTFFGDETSITFNQSFFTTQINKPLVLDTFKFVNKDKPILTSGFESNIRLRVDEFQIFFAYTFIDARRKYDNTQIFVPLTPQHKINLDIIYEKEDNFSVALEGYSISSMFRDFDTKTKQYYTIGLIAQKHFKNYTIIANCENLFDVRQTRFENIIILPNDNPTFRQVYAPLDGRVFNIAMRIEL